MRHLTLTDEFPSFELTSGNRRGGGAGGSGLPMAMHNTVKAAGKEVKIQKKQSRKEKLANFDRRGEERPSLGVKKSTSSRRSKSRVAGSGGRRNSHAPQMAGHASDKILSLDGLFSE